MQYNEVILLTALNEEFPSWKYIYIKRSNLTIWLQILKFSLIKDQINQSPYDIIPNPQRTGTIFLTACLFVDVLLET